LSVPGVRGNPQSVAGVPVPWKRARIQGNTGARHSETGCPSLGRVALVPLKRGSLPRKMYPAPPKKGDPLLCKSVPVRRKRGTAVPRKRGSPAPRMRRPVPRKRVPIPRQGIAGPRTGGTRYSEKWEPVLRERRTRHSTKAVRPTEMGYLRLGKGYPRPSEMGVRGHRSRGARSADKG
jgi:hypothetical protein